MKNNLRFLLLMVIGIGFSALTNAQTTPQFFNSNNATSNNAFPLNSATSNKVQWINGPNAFSSLGGGLGVPAYSGNITRVYFRIQTGFTTNPTSTYNIQLSLGQSVGTQLAFTNATYITGITQVYSNNSFNFTGIVAGQWYGITLSIPFTYNPSLSLIYEMKQTGGTGNTLAQGNFTSGDRIWGPYAAAVGANFGGGRVDFGFDLTPNTPCVGTPTGGTTTGPINPCPGVPATYYLTGATLAGGLSYQWIRSSVGCNGPWIPMLNDTFSSMTTLPPVNTTTYYRCVVTCNNTMLSDTSSCLPVTPQTWNPYSPCYCNNSFPTLATLTDIGQFSIGSLTNPAVAPPQLNNPASINTYSNFDTLLPIPILIQGQSYPISILQTNSNTALYTSWAKTWIDYNHNTSWLDPGEEIFSSSVDGTNGYAPSGTFNVPTTALPGVTRLRAVLRQAGTAANTDPCGSYTNYGETEDYVVNILAAGPHDPAITNISVAPAGGCMDSCENVQLTISNFGATTLDLSLNPLIVKLNINGPTGLTVYTDTLSNGFLAAFNANSTFLNFPCVNFHEGGCYTINTDTLALIGSFNTNKVNDSLFTAITICNSRPNPVDYTLCLGDVIPTGQGLSISNCPTGFVTDSVVIPFTLSFSGNTPPNPTSTAPTGASLFATGILPTLPASTNILSGELSVNNLQLAPLTFTTGPNLTRFSLFAGPTPAPNAMIYHGGLQGSPLTSLPFGCFNYLSNPPAVDLNTMYTAGVPTISPNLNLGHWSTNRPTAPNVLANCGGATVAYLKLYYEYIPVGIKWYEQKTGGVSISNASPFDPLTTTNTIVNNSNSIGTYTFFGACAADTNCRVEVDLIVTGLTYLSVLDTNINCNGASTGSIAASVGGGVPPYTYSLTGGPITPPTNTNGYFANLPAGTYTLNATDNAGCGAGDSIITISEPAALVIDSIVSTTPSCSPGCDAILTVYASGGTSPFTSYNIGSGPQASNIFPNQCGNTYTVTVTDANGCTAQSTHTIIASTAPTWVSLSSSNPQCFGDTTGTISVVALPGSNPIITYSNVPAPPTLTQPTSGNFTGVGAGSYTLRATDDNSCFIDTTVTITQPPQIQFASVISTPTTCNGASTGSITVTAGGGTPGYTYTKMSPAPIVGPNAIGNFTGLAAGSYTIRITDTLGCIRDSVINVTQPAVLALSVTSTTNVLCRGDSTGVIVVTGTGGTPPMNSTSWTISPNIGTQSGNRTFSGLPANTYTITGTDANGCTAVTTVTITQPATNVQITNVTSTTPSCVPGCDATMTITATGGTVPSYSYSNGTPPNQASPIFTNQCAGTYTVSVTDGNGCIATSSHTISTPGSPSWGPNSVTKVDVSCNGGNNGSISFAATVGASPTITYNLIAPLPGTPNITSPLSNLSAGSYTIQAVDGNGCSVQTVVTISEPPVLSVGTVVVDSVDCNGGNTGGATVTAVGGTPQYTFSINSIPVQSNNTGIFTNLIAGGYTITITDANGCSVTSTITVHQPTALSYTSIATTNVSCFGANDGEIIAQSTGGTGAITTLLLPLPGTSPSPITPPTFSGLNGGTKIIRITDANGCMLDTTINISEPALFAIDTASVTDVLCKGDSTGVIVMTRAGGTGAVMYGILPNLGTQSPAGDSTISNLPAGIYMLMATDANGCTATRSVTITEPATKVDITAITGTTPTCVPGNDGTITPTATGGTGPLIILLPPSTTPYPYPGTITGLGSATYVVRVQDANGCFADTTYTITNSSAPTVDSTKNTPALCFGASTGTLEVFATGTPQSSVTYAITAPTAFVTPPQASGLFTGLAAGFYTIQVNDANNCPVSTTVTIGQPTPLAFSSVLRDSVNCFGGNDGSITVTGSGGMPPYTATPAPNTGLSPTFTFSNRTAGVYNIQLTDANGCTVSSAVTIAQPAAVTVDSVASTDVLCNGGSTGSLFIKSIGGTGTMVYSIPSLPAPNSNMTGIFTGLAATNYTVVSTDVYGCNISTTITVNEPTALSQTFVTRNVSCFGGNDGRIVLTGAGGVSPYEYGLLPNSPLVTPQDTFGNLAAGSIYQGIVRDANGCRDTSTNITITQPPQMVFTSVTKTDIDCFGASTGDITVASNMGTGGHSYNITPDLNNVGILIGSPKTFSNLRGGTYIITATDANNCSITTSVTVIENPQIFFSSITNTEERCFGDGQASISFQAAGGVGNFTYIFNNNPPASTQTTYTGLTSGTYSIEAIDGLGCSADTSYSLSGPDPITFTEFDIIPTNCLDTEDGKLTVKATGGRGTDYTYSLDAGFRINTNGEFRDLAPKDYNLRVTDSAGCFIDTAVTIPLPISPLTIDVIKQDLGCHGRGNEGTAEAITTGGMPPYTYLWSSTPVQTTARAEGLYQGVHTVDVVDALGCLERDTIIIEPGPCCQEVFLPNAFSPNGDGRNDEFRILSTANMELQQFEVRNRWGMKIWETTNMRSSWDGKYGTEPVGVGTYYYILRYKCLTDGQTYTVKGDVIIVR